MIIWSGGLEEDERRNAIKEAVAFLKTAPLGAIPLGRGTHRQIRDGLGVTITGYTVDHSQKPPVSTVQGTIWAWKTNRCSS